MADSHLGFSSFNRVDKNGRNLVEEMFYQGFDQALDKIIELKPDAVVHAGDVFHHVRPRIRPLFVFKKGLEKLTDAGIPVIVISGNHDSPKGYAATSPFVIFEGTKDVHIARKYVYEPFELGDYTFHCIPFCMVPQEYAKEFGRIQRSGRDVLVMHGLTESLRNRRLKTVGEHELGDSFLKSDFDYIALGHFHAQLQVAANAWYSGSVEYFNFGEAKDTKGILQVDLDRREVKQIAVRQSYMLDRPEVDCSGMSTEELAETLLDLCDQDEIRDKIVRINLKNVNRAAYRNLSQARVNRLIAPAIHLKIKAEFAGEEERRGEPIARFNLHQEFVKFLDDESSRDFIPRTLKDEVMGYGSKLIKKAVAARNTEALDAPE